MSTQQQPVRPQFLTQWLPTDTLRFCATNPPSRIEDVDDLVESLKAIPQQVPAIVFKCPDGLYEPADGNRRLMAKRILGEPLLCVVLEQEPTKAELRRIRISVNNSHKHMTPAEVADEIAAHITETGCSQDEAAEFFSLHPSYVSKLLSPSKSLLPEFHCLCGMKGVCRDIVRIVATMPSEDLQRKVGQKVLEDVEKHGRAKRSTIEMYADGLKDKKPKGKPKDQKVKEDGATLIYPGDWAASKVAEALGKLLKRFKQG